MEEKELKLRQLTGEEIFTISEIMEKMDIDFTSFDFDFTGKKEKDMTDAELKENGKKKLKLVLTIFSTFLKRVHLAKKEVNTLLADLAGVKVEEIKKLSLSKYLKLLYQLKEDEEIMGFFRLQTE